METHPGHIQCERQLFQNKYLTPPHVQMSRVIDLFQPPSHRTYNSYIVRPTSRVVTYNISSVGAMLGDAVVFLSTTG